MSCFLAGGEFTKSAIAEFVFQNKLPLVTYFTRESASEIFENPIKKQVIIKLTIAGWSWVVFLSFVLHVLFLIHSWYFLPLPKIQTSFCQYFKRLWKLLKERWESYHLFQICTIMGIYECLMYTKKEKKGFLILGNMLRRKKSLYLGQLVTL